MPSNKSPSIVNAGPGRLASGQVPASALSFPVSEGDLGGRELATPTRNALVTPGSPVASVVLPAQTFVGNAPSYPLEMLFQVVDSADRSIFNAGTRVVVTSLTGATVGAGFTPGTVTINLTPSVPTGVQYRVYYATRATYASLPVDSLTFDRVFGLYADAIAYAGSPNWASGAPLTATTVETAIDAIVSDLALSTAPSGARRIGFQAGNVNWANASVNTAFTNVQQTLDDIVTKLAATSGTTGSELIGTDFTATWVIGGGNIVASTTVFGGLNDIVLDLRGTTSVSNNGGRRVGTVITNTWADASGISAANLSDAVSEIVSDLGGASGSSRIGFAGSVSQWADNSALAAGSVNSALNGVLTAIGTTASGNKIGASDTWKGTIDFSGGGGIHASTIDLNTALHNLDNAAVARRAFTAVISDTGLTSGGDINQTDISQVFANGSPWIGGRFYVRPGNYTIGSDLTSATLTVSLIGDNGQASANDGYPMISTSAARLVTSATGKSGNLFEFIYFTVSAASALWTFTGSGATSMRHCRFSAGSCALSGGVISIDGLRIVDDVGGSNKNYGMTIPAGSASGEVRNLYVDTVPSSASSDKQLVNFINSTHAKPLVFDTCEFNAVNGFAGGFLARCVFFTGSTQPVVFRNCTFTMAAGVAGPGTGYLVDMINASNVTFEDCTFTQNGDGRLINVPGTCSNIKFIRCKLFSSPSNINSSEITFCSGDSTMPSKFIDCSVYLRAGDAATVAARLYFGSVAGTGSGACGPELRNVHFHLNYADPGLGKALFNYKNGNLGISTTVQDVHFHLNSKQPVLASNDSILSFVKNAADSDFIDVHGLHFFDVRAPSSGDELGFLTILNGARVYGGSAQANPGGTEVAWKGVFGMFGQGSGVANFHFWGNGLATRGRHTHIEANKCYVRHCRTNIVTVHTGENDDGYFVNVASGQFAVIEDNVFEISAGNYGSLNVATAFIDLINGYAAAIRNNTVILTPATANQVRIIQGDLGSHNMLISDNQFWFNSSHASASPAIEMGGDFCLVTDSRLANVNGAAVTPTVINAGTSSVTIHMITTP